MQVPTLRTATTRKPTMHVRLDRTPTLFLGILAVVPLMASVFIIWFAPPTMAHAWHWILDAVILGIVGYWLHELHRQRQRRKQSRQRSRSQAS